MCWLVPGDELAEFEKRILEPYFGLRLDNLSPALKTSLLRMICAIDFYTPSHGSRVIRRSPGILIESLRRPVASLES